MTINIICETTPGFSFHYKKLAESVIEHSLDTEGFPYEAEVNLTLVDEERIHEIVVKMRFLDSYATSFFTKYPHVISPFYKVTISNI